MADVKIQDATPTTHAALDNKIPVYDGTLAPTVITPHQILDLGVNEGVIAPALTADENYVTDAEKAKLANLGTAAYENTSAFDAAGTAGTAVSNHVAAANPHIQYAQTSSLGTAAYENSTAFDAAGAATGAIAAHVLENDPHSQYLKESDAVISFEQLANKGQANGYAPLGAAAKIDEIYLPDSVLGQVEYQGVWDATTNTPTIPAASSANKGYYYIVSVSGTTEIDGISDWTIGDWIVSNGTAWNKIDNTDSVSSVFGRAGAIVANSGDYTADQITETTTRAFVSPAEKTAITHENRSALDNVQGINTGDQDLSGLVPKTRTINSKPLTDDITLTSADVGSDPAGTAAALVEALLGAPPEALDTLNELAAALGDDPNFATTVLNALSGKQPIDATLTALAALSTAANTLIYAIGSDQFATTDFTAFARTLLAVADAASARTALGLGSVATQAANNVAFTGGNISGLASLTNSGNTTLGDAAGDVTTIPDLKALQLTSANRANVRPSLLLAFGNSKVVDSRITFTRSSTATSFSELSALTTAAVNEPRIFYDYSSKICKGLLLEESSTNLLLNSDVLSTQDITTSAVSYALSFYGTGTVTLSGTYSQTVVGTSAYDRSILVFTPTAGTLTLTVSGTVTYAQLEVGSYPTSYIPTTVSSVTRAIDLAGLLSTSFSSWYNQSEGTIVVELEWPTVSSTSTAAGFSVSDGTTNNRIILSRSGTGNTPQMVVSVSGVNQAAVYAGTVQANTLFKVAMSYKANSFHFALNGTQTANSTDVSGTVPTVDRFYFGSETGAVAAKYIKRFAYYPKQFTGEELKGLSSL